MIKGNEISIQKLQSGNRQEFARLVDEFSPKIYRLALKMLNNPQDAEDVLQNTFLKAYRALPEFEARSSLSTWLYRIAVNEALMLVRKREPEMISIEEPDPGAEDEDAEQMEIVDWCCLPERELMSEESRKVMEKAARRLSPGLRMVFVLRDIEGLSVKETAEMLNISEMAVKTRLSRARLQLRQELTQYFGGIVKEKSTK